VHGVVVIEVVDDGVGATMGPRRSGLANLEARARTYGGDFVFESEPGNTRSRWSAPYQETSEEAER
jgi:signal transduction histidine kinase